MEKKKKKCVELLESASFNKASGKESEQNEMWGKHFFQHETLTLVSLGEAAEDLERDFEKVSPSCRYKR